MGNIRLLEPERKTPPKEKMTWEEFLNWADEDTHAEWVNGGLTMTMPAGKRHQDIVYFLLSLLKKYVRAKKLGEVLFAPFLMRIENAPSGREPDILFLQNKNLKRLHETYVEGPSDLVVEVISPESIARDRGDKFIEYEQAKIPEYWLIDPVRTRAEFYVLNRKGHYQLVEPDEKGNYHSQVVDGFWIHVAWLWQDPPPSEEEAYKRIQRRR